MKTEKEFSDLFLNTCKQSMNPSDELKKLSSQYWIDLTGHLNNVYFSIEDRYQITVKAAELLNMNIISQDLQTAWLNTVRDFNATNYWGFQTIQHKPKPPQTAEQKIFWQLFKYVWAFFQSMIILKIAVYYFGLESAQNPNETSVLWVWFFFSLSVFSLVFFAYRNRKDQG